MAKKKLKTEAVKSDVDLEAYTRLQEQNKAFFKLLGLDKIEQRLGARIMSILRDVPFDDWPSLCANTLRVMRAEDNYSLDWGAFLLTLPVSNTAEQQIDTPVPEVATPEDILPEDEAPTEVPEYELPADHAEII